MKLELFRYENNKTYDISEELDVSKFSFPNNYKILKIDHCLVNLKVTRFDLLSRVRVHLEGSLTAICSRSGKPFEFKFKTNEEMSFSNNENDVASYYEPNDVIDLDPYLIGIIDNLVPINVIKPGEDKPIDGNGYRVLTEEELNKERGNKHDTRWDILDDIEL